MSKRKKKKIKERKHQVRQFQQTAETLLSALYEKPIKTKHNLSSKIGRNR